VKFLFHLLLLVAFSALLGAAWVAHRPTSLANIGGLEPLAKTAKNRDVLDDLRQASIKRSAILEISEADLNRHLAVSLGSQVAPPLNQWVKFERVVMDLEPEIAHAILIWKVGNHRSTATVDLRIVRLEKAFQVEIVGGRYGHLEVPRGLLRPLTPVLQSLSIALEEDIQGLFQMNQMKLLKDKLVLDPRFP
jgi:hypothetical protein